MAAEPASWGGFEMVAISRHFRWSLAVRGIVAIIFGILAWGWPAITLMTLLLIFGLYALVDGLFALVGSVVHRRVLADWWLVLLVALASIFLGVITLVRPGVTALVLLFFIGARALVVGGLEIAAAIEYRRLIRHEWLLVLAGIISVLFGLAVLVSPVSGAMAVLWLIGLYAILVGILQLAFAITARGAEEVLPAEGRPAMA